MMKRALILSIVLIAGCSFFVTKPEVTVKSMTFSGLERDGIEMELLLSVTNPNSYDLTLTGYRYTLLAADLPMANGEKKGNVEFKGKTATDFRLPVRITFRDLAEVLNHRPDPQHIPYQLVAGFDLATPFGAVSIPIRKNGNLSLPSKFRPDDVLRQFNQLFNKKAK